MQSLSPAKSLGHRPASIRHRHFLATTTKERCSPTIYYLSYYRSSSTTAEAMTTMPPRLAIIDGTHLCLLPSSSGRLLQQLQSTAASSANSNVAAAVVVVPALPLSSIWDRFHCGNEEGDDDNNNDIDCDASYLKMDTFILHMSDLSNYNDDVDDSSNNCHNYSSGSIIRLMRHSQSLLVDNSVSNGENDKSSTTSILPLRIVALHDDDDDIMAMEETTTKIAMNANENRMEIHILSFASPSDRDDDYYDNEGCHNIPLDDNEDESDDCIIYGGGYYNLASEEEEEEGGGSNSNSGVIIESAEPSTAAAMAALDIMGAGSYLVADFFGVPGYEQVLVLPHLVMDDAKLLSDMAVWDNNDEIIHGGTTNDEILQRRMELLQLILEHSFITDGVTITHPVPPSSTQSQLSLNNPATTKTQQESYLSKTKAKSSCITIPPLLLTLEDEEDTAMVDRRNNGKRRKRRIVAKTTPVENGDAINTESTTISEALSTTTTREDIPGEISNAFLGEDGKESSHPAWLNAIAHTVEHRLAAELSEVERIERSAQICLDLVDEGRKTLHSATRSGTTGDNDDPEAIRLRYGIRPRASSIENNCGGISVVLDLEVDLLMGPSTTNTNAATSKGDEVSNVGITLHDFHLSCSLANRASSLATSPKTIRTVSGIVPTLQSGDCITILASVHLADLRLNVTPMQEESRSSPSPMLDICIQGLWVKEDSNGVSEYPSTSANNDGSKATTSDRHGAVLCILRLPVETIFLAPPASSPPPQSNHWIQYEFDFIAASKSRCRTTSSGQSVSDIDPTPILPTAVFEYRSPRTLTIDTSSAIQDAKIWKDLVTNMNARVGGNTFIDLYWKKGDPRFNLVIFGSNMEERAGELCKSSR